MSLNRTPSSPTARYLEACLVLLQSEPVETGNVEDMRRGPTLESLPPKYAETPFSRAVAINSQVTR